MTMTEKQDTYPLLKNSQNVYANCWVFLRSFGGLIIQSTYVTVMLVPMPNSEEIKVSYTDQIQTRQIKVRKM